MIMGIGLMGVRMAGGRLGEFGCQGDETMYERTRIRMSNGSVAVEPIKLKWFISEPVQLVDDGNIKERDEYE